MPPLSLYMHWSLRRCRSANGAFRRCQATGLERQLSEVQRDCTLTSLVHASSKMSEICGPNNALTPKS